MNMKEKLEKIFDKLKSEQYRLNELALTSKTKDDTVKYNDKACKVAKAKQKIREKLILLNRK